MRSPYPVPTTRGHRCYYCTDHPGLVTVEDKYAEKLSDGSWKCGDCVTTDLRRRMVRILGPDNPEVREFLQEEHKRLITGTDFLKILIMCQDVKL